MVADYALLSPLWLLGLPLLLVLLRWPGPSLAGLMLRPVRLRHPQAAAWAEREPARATPGWQRHLAVLVLALLLLALAQPVRYGAPLPQQPAPMQLMLVVDTSVSMVLRDYELDGRRVDRLSLAKTLLDRFVADFHGREVGLVVLGQPPALWVPLTADHALLRRLLARLQPVMAGRHAALGDALALTADNFPARDGQPRAVVLITDAVSPGGRLSPQEGARRLRDAGLTLHTVAVGAVGGALEGRPSELLYEPADLGLLNELAGITDGLSFHAREAADLQRALRQIEAHHRPAMRFEPRARLRHPLYHWPLGAALLLLAAVPWLGARQGRAARA